MLELAAFSLLFPDLGDLDQFYLPSIQGGLTSTGPDGRHIKVSGDDTQNSLFEGW